MKKVIVAGSRNIETVDEVLDAISRAPFRDFELVHGGANGVDNIAKKLAEHNRITVKEITEFEPDWDEHGKAAGPIRNEEMAEYADALIAVWDGISSGTRNMIETALGHGLEIYVYQVHDFKSKS